MELWIRWTQLDVLSLVMRDIAAIAVILTGDPMLETLRTPAITPAQLPADITDFTGRKAQLAPRLTS